ncbi:MAG: NAD(P)H-dependent oxidoreductase [Clostridia bacterium]|nr:NAD(P)H-dependent oxidoreductase [Clostridia bacterium]
MKPLLVVHNNINRRLSGVLEYALYGTECEFLRLPCPPGALRARKVVFALSLGEYGMDSELYELLLWLRRDASAMEGSAAVMIIDGQGELYTKHLAQMLALAANGAGCLFPGKPLVEATGSLENLRTLSRRMEIPLETAYLQLTRELTERLAAFAAPKFEQPELLMLHASEKRTSNTLAIGERVCALLDGDFGIREISLQNGRIHDCRGCSYKTCSHFAQSNGCFYGGSIVDEVFPALLQSNALLLLCPNYNDSVSANIMAFINRLTALLVNNSLYDKYVYSVVVSGYSGSDIVAQQTLGALCLNKTLMLPPRFAFMLTANDPGDAMRAARVDERIAEFAARMRRQLMS